MLKKITLLTSFVLLAVLAIDAHFNYSISNGSGSPAGKSGGPAGGGASCKSSGCHDSYTGNFVASANSIVVTAAGTTTPVTAYTPGAVYDVAVTSSNFTNAKSGFEASFETASGHAGVITSLSASTALVGSGHYITHTSTSTSGPVVAWLFQWTAPSAGAGTVTVYAAINKANNDFTRIGDSIKLATLALTEIGGTGIADLNASTMQLTSFPNPVMNELVVNYSTTAAAANVISIYALNGSLVNQLNLGTEKAGAHATSIDARNLATGTYVVTLQSGSTTISKKIVKN
jgi:hypothetical protein